MERERRGMYAGICMILGAIPLVLFYGFHPIGFFAVSLAVVGFLLSYGAYRMSTTYS